MDDTRNGRFMKVMTTEPVLSFVKRDGQFKLDIGASNLSIGAALSQIQDGEEITILFYNKSFESETAVLQEENYLQLYMGFTIATIMRL